MKEHANGQTDKKTHKHTINQSNKQTTEQIYYLLFKEENKRIKTQIRRNPRKSKSKSKFAMYLPTVKLL